MLDLAATPQSQKPRMTHDCYSTKRTTVWPQERDGAPGYAIKYADGYISWCPEQSFARDYRSVHGGHLTFGQAIESLKSGHRVRRLGWNGKGMWLKLQRGSTVLAEHAKGDSAVKARAEEGEDQIVVLPHIDMRAADGGIVIGWLASQTDMLADDWEEIV